MNKENRDELIALKQSVISDLHNIDVDSYKLDRADERLNVYILNISRHTLLFLVWMKRFLTTGISISTFLKGLFRKMVRQQVSQWPLHWLLP